MQPVKWVTREELRAMYPDAPGKAPPQPEGRVVARTVQIDVSEMLDLHTGYAREGWQQFMWLSGWRARVAVAVLKFLC